MADVSTAFLRAKLDDDDVVYVIPPPTDKKPGKFGESGRRYTAYAARRSTSRSTLPGSCVDLATRDRVQIHNCIGILKMVRSSLHTLMISSSLLRTSR